MSIAIDILIALCAWLAASLLLAWGWHLAARSCQRRYIRRSGR